MLLSKLLALFILAGGVVGGVTTFLLLALYALWAAARGGYLDASIFASALPSLVWMSLLGIPVGLPASAATGSIYAANQRARINLPIALIGAAASAVWGAIFAVILSRGRLDVSALWVIGFFAASGAVAALACHNIAKHWPELVEQTE
ncbi:MAG: hypothetical protein AB7O98_16320 [Hyphomonadaceae bacterium]